MSLNYSDKEERSVLFNDTLNTFYLWLFDTAFVVHWLEREIAK